MLVITDNLRCAWAKRLFKRVRPSGDDVSVLTLGITPEYFTVIHPGLERKCKFVDVTGISQGAQRRIAEFYTEFIFRLPMRIPQELLFCRGKNLWWLLEITEKCPVRSQIINRLFYLELIQEATERAGFNRVYLDLDDFLLRKALLRWKPDIIRNISSNTAAGLQGLFFNSFFFFLIRYLKNACGIFLTSHLRSFLLKLNGIKGALPAKKEGVFFFTNYPLWWNNQFNEKAKDNFLNSLPEFIMNRYPVFYAAWLFSLNPKAIFSQRSLLKRFFSERKIFLLEPLLSLKQKLGVLSLGYFSWSLSLRNYIQRKLKSSYRDFDITEMLGYEVSISLSHPELFNNMLIESAFRNLIERYAPSLLIYRMEFQPFEKAMLSAVDRKCRTVGFQHSTLSRNLISHFFADGEIAFHLQEANTKAAMPLPDLIFTTGPYFYQALTGMGFPADRIEVCGPVRYSHLIDYLKRSQDSPGIRRRLGLSDSEKAILVVMNWKEKEVLGLIFSLVTATQGLANMHFIIRSHPYFGFNRTISKLLKKTNPGFRYSFLGVDFPLYDAIRICEAIIQVPTTLGYEAMALGRVPIVYENGHVFNMNSSQELRGCVPIVSSAGQLKDALRKVLDKDKNNNYSGPGWNMVLERLFYDLENDPRERFLALLRKHKALN